MEQITKLKAASQKSIRGVPLKSEVKLAKPVYVIRQVEKSGNTASDPQKRAEIEILRSEVKKLTAKLAAAQQKLSALERGNPDTALSHVSFTTDP